MQRHRIECTHTKQSSSQAADGGSATTKQKKTKTKQTGYVDTDMSVPTSDHWLVQQECIRIVFSLILCDIYTHPNHRLVRCHLVVVVVCVGGVLFCLYLYSLMLITKFILIFNVFTRNVFCASTAAATTTITSTTDQQQCVEETVKAFPTNNNNNNNGNINICVRITVIHMPNDIEHGNGFAYENWSS